MNYSSLAILCGVALLLCLVVPASCAVTPLWMEAGSTSSELSGVVISADGSTIIAGGDQLISLTPEGRERWAGWSGTSLAVSSDGDYILASKGQNLRLISGAGTLIWEKSMDITVTDLSMTPNASVIAAAGRGRVQDNEVFGRRHRVECNPGRQPYRDHAARRPDPYHHE